jgi:hypothetical protein
MPYAIEYYSHLNKLKFKTFSLVGLEVMLDKYGKFGPISVYKENPYVPKETTVVN